MDAEYSNQPKNAHELCESGEFVPTARQLAVMNLTRINMPPWTTLTQNGLYRCDQRDARISDMEFNFDEIELCIQWIRHFVTPRAHKNANYSSYYLKHRVEAFATEFGLEPTYISNGSFIAAMLVCGYTMWPCDPYSLNAYFNATYVLVKGKK